MSIQHRTRASVEHSKLHKELTTVNEENASLRTQIRDIEAKLQTAEHEWEDCEYRLGGFIRLTHHSAKERDELRAKLQTAEATLARKDEEIARLDSECYNLRNESRINKEFALSCGSKMAPAVEKYVDSLKQRLQTSEATLGTLMLWIEEANASVTDEEWDRCMKTPSGMVTRPRVDNMLASRLQQLREKVAGLQLGNKDQEINSGT